MKNWVEQINNINNIDQFINFLSDLSVDFRENPEEWENINIPDYLEQMSAWLEDYSRVDNETDWNNVDYKTYAKILYMGKLYE